MIVINCCCWLFIDMRFSVLLSAASYLLLLFVIWW